MSRIMLFCFALMIAVSNQANASAVKNDEDAYLESMMFGDIPEVFSALKISQNLMKAPASITVWTKEDISTSGARTLGDLFKYVPGLYVTSSRSGYDLLKIRGAQDSNNNRVLIIIDGIPRRDLFLGHTSINELVPLENIEQLELIRGPGSALYGTNAYTGVISIFTKTAESSDKLKVDVGYGEFNTRKINLGLGQNIGQNSGMTLNVRLLESDGYEVERDREGQLSSGTTAKKGYNLDLKLNYKDLLFIASKSSLDFRYPWATIDSKKDREEGSSTFGIQYSSDITDTIGVNLNLYHNRFEFEENETEFDNDGVAQEFGKSIHENSVIGADAHLVFQFSDKYQLIGGVAVEREMSGQNEELERDAGEEFVVEEWIQNDEGERNFSLVNFALYLEDTWKINKQTELTIGARYDNYEQFGDSVSTRVGAVYSPIKNLTIKALYGEAFRGPNYSELFTREYDDFDNVVLSDKTNPQLQPEEITTTEFEVSYAFNNHLLAKIRYFSNTNKNAIISLGKEIPYENLAGIETDGLEFETEYSYKKLAGFLNLTINNGEKSNGEPLEGYPDYQINSVLNYSISDKIDSRIGVRFISERSRPSDYHADIDPGDINVAPLIAIDNLGSYFDVELSLIYHVNQNWSIAGFIYNLFDDENYNPSYEPASNWDQLHPGRAYFVNLTYRLTE